jgi:ribosomal protein L37AE/L43A
MTDFANRDESRLNTDKDKDKDNTITCGDCGKTNGNLQVGTHWICEDCKASVS